jgi:hypothetical protein
MTSAELYALAAKKHEEEEAAENCVKREGFLKEDLYSYDKTVVSELEESGFLEFWLYTAKEKETIIFNSFALVLKKGTRFVCFIDNGKESWFDDVNYGIEEMDAYWAGKYLENVRDVTAANT